MYNLINLRNIDATHNNRGNDSEEGSQERGSEERPKGDGQEEDELKIQKRDVDKREIDSRRIDKKRVSDTIGETTKKHVDERKVKIRTKRAIIEARVHNKKYPVQGVANRVTKPAVKENTEEELSRHKLVQKSGSIENSKEPGNWNNRKGMEDTNNDLYFDDESEKADQGENNSGDRNDENDRENDSNYNEHGSGSGDYYEWSDEDGSGSGDYEWDNEGGSGSGDDSDDEIWKAEEEVRKTRETYAEYMLNVSVALSEARGIRIPRERLVQDIADLIKFQTEFVKVT